MKPEIEAKFANVDVENLRETLHQLGATLEQPMRLMRRVLIEEPHHREERSFLRIRDEGDKVTLTYKRKSLTEEDTVDSTHELETTVGDFETTVDIFAAAGWDYITYQETRRETWQLEGVEVVIDEWPWIEPVAEVEGESEEAVRRTAEALGFEWSDAFFSSIDSVYAETYPGMSARGIIDIKEARLDDPVPKKFGPHK